MIILQALMGSFWVKVVGLTFAALLAVKAYGLAKEWQGEERGAAKVVQAVTKKADSNARVADEVREQVAAGKRGKPDPYGLR